MTLWVLYIVGKFYHFSLFLTVIDNSGTKFGSEISEFGSEIFLGKSAGNPALQTVTNTPIRWILSA